MFVKMGKYSFFNVLLRGFYVLLNLFLALSPGYTQIPDFIPGKMSNRIELTLKQIQQADTNELSGLLIGTATEWATAGYLDQANKLLENAWSYQLANSKDHYYSLQSFQVLWKISGKEPKNIPFELGSVEQIEQYNWDKLFFPGQWSPMFLEKFENKSWTSLTGDQLLTKAIILAYDGSSPNHRAGAVAQRESLRALAAYMNEDNAANRYGDLQTLNCAAILSAANGQKEKAIDFVRQWGEAYKKFYSGRYDIIELAKEKSIATILLTGLLAPVFKLNSTDCDSHLTAISNALKSRMENGQSLAYKELSMRQLLQRFSSTAVELSNQTHKEQVKKDQWLGYLPATTQAIAAAERRHGLRFPADYREFLLTTNGFKSFSNTGMTLLPVEKIGFFRDLDPQLVEAWSDPQLFGDSAIADAFANSLLIGGYEEEQQLLLVPPYKNNPDWTCWYFALWMPGEKKHPAFRFYLEQELLKLEKIY
jgi:hypothetical protein